MFGRKPKTGWRVGDIVTTTVAGQERPVIVTSVNADETVNGRLIIEPQDNPKNDGNFPTHVTNLRCVR